jgi:ATP-dependent Clp protease ATP-binding subunit ClpC
VLRPPPRGGKLGGTFERFTDEARQVVVDAQSEARALGHNYIGTEHLLLGVLAQPGQPAAEALRVQGVDPARARELLATMVPAGEEEVTGQIPFTPRAKKTLELSLRECLRTGSDRVAAQHLLLGLLAQGESVASHILSGLGVDVERLGTELVRSLPPPGAVLREARRRAPPTPGAELAFRVAPAPEVRRLLMAAGARALDDGRTEITVADVEEALRRRDDSGEPPRASTA